MGKSLGLLALWVAAVCSPLVVWAQSALLASWETGEDGWQINEEDGQKLAKRLRLSGIAATSGERCLAVALLDGNRAALRSDDVVLAELIRGHNLAIDVTAPEGTAEGPLKIGLAISADGMDRRATDLQEVPQDGKHHTLMFDLSAWPIPSNPAEFHLYVVTSTRENSQPKTIYLDNLHLPDVAQLALALPAAPTTIPTIPPLFSWEDGMGGWQLEGENGVELPRGISNSDTGATAGKRSLAIGIVDACLRYEDPSLAAELKGKRVALDVTAPEGKAEDQLQVTVAIATTGIDWKAADLQKVPRDGKPHTLVFDLSLWPLPKNPPSFDLFIVTNTKQKTAPQTFHLDNLRILPPDPPLFSWEDGLEGWVINNDGNQQHSRGVSNAEIGATAGKKSLAIDMLDGFQSAIRYEGPSLAAKLRGQKIALDVTAPRDAAQDYVQIHIGITTQGMTYRGSEFLEVPMDGKPHTLVFDTSSWPIPATPPWLTLFIVTNTAPKSSPKTIYIDNLRIAPQQ